MKLPAVSGRQAIAVFTRLGYLEDRQRGSHIISATRTRRTAV